MIRASKDSKRFFIDNCIIDDGFVAHIGHSAALVYMALCRYANYKTQVAFPSQKKLAELLKMDVKTVRRGIKALIDHTMLEKRQVGKKCCNRYRLLDRSGWANEPRVNLSAKSGANSPTTIGATGPLHSNENKEKKEKKENKKSTSNMDREETIFSQKGEKWSHGHFLRWLYSTGAEYDRVYLLYLWVKQYHFLNKEMAKQSYDENVPYARALADYGRKAILDTFAYLDFDSKCKWLERWNLKTAVKYVNDIYVGDLRIKGPYDYSFEELHEILGITKKSGETDEQSMGAPDNEINVYDTEIITDSSCEPAY